MTKLTVKYLQALTIADAGKTIRDEGGLSAKVALTQKGISLSFYYQFRWEGKYSRHACGTWPGADLKAIREIRDNARQCIALGLNPNEQKRFDRHQRKTEAAEQLALAETLKKQELTVYDLAQDWLLNGVARKDNNAELGRRFAKDLYPVLGKIPLREITEHDLRNALRNIFAREANRQAIGFFADVTQMFKWASKRQPWRALMIDGNPTELVDIANLIPADYETERSRILSPAELLELSDRFREMTADYAALPAGQKYDGIRPLKKETQLALWICLATLCRIGELLKAEWKNVDLENHTWLIPSENVKGPRGKKQDLHVFLSAFALESFKELHELTGHTPWCFPAKNNEGPVDSKVVSKQIGDRQAQFKLRKPLSRRCHDNTLVLANGQNGCWTPHDMRRTGATMMQALEVSLDVIDRCQNHVLAGSRVRRHYLHYDYAQEKKRAWDLLGERLQEIFNTSPQDDTQLSFKY